MSTTANYGVEVGIIAKGRIAWILAIIVGAAMAIVGGALGATKSWAWNHSTPGWLLGVGGAFAVIGVIFLIASYATKGASD